MFCILSTNCALPHRNNMNFFFFFLLLQKHLKMWTSLSGPPESPAPSSRTKHSATLLGSHVYLFGGRNGNVPLKDMWRYNLSKWDLKVCLVIDVSWQTWEPPFSRTIWPLSEKWICEWIIIGGSYLLFPAAPRGSLGRRQISVENSNECEGNVNTESSLEIEIL